MKKQIAVSLLLMMLASWAFSQQASTLFQSKYHMLDSSELYTPLIKSKAFTPTAPPPAPVRSVAEWEPTEAVLVAYPGSFGIPYSLIAEMSQDCKVITIVESSSQQTSVTNSYNSNGVNIANCLFYIGPLESYWIRDFGPWFIVNGNNKVAIVDFPYNRSNRPNDDNIPVLMASYLNVPLYGMDVTHTGGNYMSDGLGAAASTTLVLDENSSLTQSDIDTLVKNFLGITNYHITADPLGEYIMHIDCWGKFLDVDKILIAQVPVSNSQYSAYEAVATYWQNEISSYGNNYQVYRVYEDNGQPYTNSFILNNKVLIPFASGSTSQNNAAKAVYQQAMPGYEVIGFSQLSSAPWEATDAMHCRVHEVADRNMLYISHYPLLGEKPLLSQYLITATITSLSNSTIIADSVWFRYKVNNGSWQQVSMNHTTGNTWQGYISQVSAGDTIRYYIHASDQYPKSVTHPLIGAPDPHKFWIAEGANISTTVSEKEKTLVFPNPANKELFVVLRHQPEAKGFVKISNNLGNTVRQINLSDYPNQFIKLDVSGLDAGSYFVSVQTDEKVTTSKIIIMH